jgi:hypothetical protein
VPSAPASNRLAGVETAPVTPDGNLAGRPTDLVVHFAGSPDPAVHGRTLRAGRSLRITPPPAFVDTGTLPFLDHASDPRCGPRALACNTAGLP